MRPLHDNKQLDLRLSQRFRDAGLDSLDFGRTKASERPLVLGAAETRAHGTLQLFYGDTNGWPSFTGQRFGRHFEVLEGFVGTTIGKMRERGSGGGTLDVFIWVIYK